MTRTTKRVTRTVKLITNPRPNWVSLVNHGANQSGFRAVKIADVTEEKPKENDMKTKANEAVTKGNQPDVEINKIVFKTDKFPTEDSVKEYLTGKGYSEFTVEKLDDVFVVQAIDENAFESISRMPGSDEGVTMFVGKLNADSGVASTVGKGDVHIHVEHNINPPKKTKPNVNGEGEQFDPKNAATGNIGGKKAGEEAPATGVAVTAASRSRDMLLFPVAQKTEATATAPATGNTSEEKVYLTVAERKALPDTDFALDGRRYPIQNVAQAKNSLVRVAKNGTPEDKKNVRAAVYTRYADLKPTDQTQIETETKADEAVRKVDTYRTYYTDETSIAEVLADAEDGIPVGFCDISSAFVGALKNLVKNGEASQISTLCAEYGTLLTKLADLTSAMEANSAKDEAIERLFESSKVPSSDVTNTQSDSSEAAVAKAAAALKTDDPAIAKAVQPVAEALLAVADSIKTMKTHVTEEVAKVANRVVKLERLRQDRKSGNADDVTTSGKEVKGDEKTRKSMPATTANLFGFQSAAKANEDGSIPITI